MSQPPHVGKSQWSGPCRTRPLESGRGKSGCINQSRTCGRRGFSRNAVVARTGVCWRTVDKYWDMTLEEYERHEQVGRPAARALEAYDDVIVRWLREWPDMTAAQVLD